MKIESVQVGQFLKVNIDEVLDKSSIISTIESCANGQCACSTDEYQKVSSIVIEPGANSIHLNIEVKPGETIDPACISECLEPNA